MKKILIIAPCFAPENVIASIRLTKISKYLKRMGYHITVICVENFQVDKKDKILENDVRELDQIYRLPPSVFDRIVKKIYSGLESKNKKVKSVKQTQKKIENNVTFFDRIIKSKPYYFLMELYVYISETLLGYDFIRFVKKNKIGNFDCVISTYGPLSGHMLGRYMKKKSGCSKWIAEFRDLMDDYSGRTVVRNVRERFFAKVCVESDIVVGLTKEMLAGLEKFTRQYFSKSIKGKAHCISNGFDPEDSNYLLSNDNGQKLVLAYCGLIYCDGDKYLRNPEPLFQAINELSDEKKIDLRKIEIHYAGRNSDQFIKVVTKYKLNEAVIDHGFVERYQSLNLQRGADIVLSLSWNTKRDRAAITGKIFEAFLVERNVLCLISGDMPNSPLAAIIKESGIGYVWQEGNGDNLEGIKDWFLKCYNEKFNNGKLSYHKNSNVIDKYSYPYLASKYAELLE